MSQKIEYEFSDLEDQIYQRHQEENDDDKEPPDKVTKWIVGIIVILGVIAILSQLKRC